VPVTPADLKYGQDHMWARPNANGGLVRVGLTDFAQGSLGDVVEVSLPGLGVTVDAGEPCGDIESVKSVNDLIAPVSGTVRRRNDELDNAPELINSDPYGQGWMFEIEADPTTLTTQLGALLDAHAYGGLTGA
jgi:glycine cleavage system H protein